MKKKFTSTKSESKSEFDNVCDYIIRRNKQKSAGPILDRIAFEKIALQLCLMDNKKKATVHLKKIIELMNQKILQDHCS